jgi:hypothetical protein
LYFPRIFYPTRRGSGYYRYDNADYSQFQAGNYGSELNPNTMPGPQENFNFENNRA